MYFRACWRHLQEAPYLAFQFLVHQLAVNTCPNVLVKCSLLTEALFFFKISGRSLMMYNKQLKPTAT
jgi:hypothetical protein